MLKSKRSKIIASLAGLIVICCIALFAIVIYQSNTPEGQATSTARATAASFSLSAKSEISVGSSDS